MKIILSLIVVLGSIFAPKPETANVNLLVVGPQDQLACELDHVQNIVLAAGKTITIGNTQDISQIPEGNWDRVIVLGSLDKAAVSNLKKSVEKKAVIFTIQNDIKNDKARGGIELLPFDSLKKNMEAFTRDGDLFDGPVGCYARACCIYEIIYDVKVFGSRYHAGLTEENLRNAQLCADAAVKKPGKVKLQK